MRKCAKNDQNRTKNRVTATVVGRATVIGTLWDLLSTYIIFVYKEIANNGESYTNVCTIV